MVRAKCDVIDTWVRDTFKGDFKLVRAEPEPEIEGNTLLWNIDKLSAGECKTYTAWVTVDEEGCLIDCVTCDCCPSICTATSFGQCQLDIEKTGPDCLCVGGHGTFNITVMNDGTSTAENVTITDDLPDGLRHPSGKDQVEWCVGDLEAGCKRMFSICLEATEAGEQCNIARAKADNHDEVSAQTCTEVVYSEIELTKSGPSEVLIGKHADYTITVVNKGSVELSNVSITDIVPGSLQVVDAGGGQCCNGNVTWHVDSLAAGASHSVNLSLTTCQCGQTCNEARVSGCSECCPPVCASDTLATCWKGHPGLLIEMIDTCDPMLVGECTTYRIRVTNQGTALDEDIQVVVDFPEQLEPQNASGSTNGSVEGQRVTFGMKDKLCPGESICYEICARANTTGDARVKATLSSKALQTPVIEEESTYVY